MGALAGRVSGGRRRHIADINVTPMVDVMLVLLLVFMIAAPMLATGVAVNLPKVRATPLTTTKDQPLLVTVDKGGRIFLGMEKTPAEITNVPDKLKAIAGGMLDKRVYVSGDDDGKYGRVVFVLARLREAGFSNAALLVDSRIAAAPPQSVDAERSKP